MLSIPAIAPRVFPRVGFLCLLPILLGGCAVTTQFDQGQVVTRSVGLGAAQPMRCGADGNSIRSQVFGLGIGAQKAVLGYAQDDQICLPLDSCSAIFVIETAAQVRAIRAAFPTLPPACLVGTARFSPSNEG